MPLLLRPSPVAGRALAWRSSSRSDAAAASRTSLAPLSAVRHFFRDHSTDAHDSQTSHDSHRDHLGPHHHHHHHPHGHDHRRHPNHRRAPELSSDWPSLYLAGKLALWSGLCYSPYDTLPRALQEEGLKLVAYGRTSYTCWYVADGYVDFEALPRRAFPRQQPVQQQHQQQQQQGNSAGGSGDGALNGTHSSDNRSSSSTGGGNEAVAAVAVAASNGGTSGEPRPSQRGADIGERQRDHTRQHHQQQGQEVVHPDNSRQGLGSGGSGGLESAGSMAGSSSNGGGHASVSRDRNHANGYGGSSSGGGGGHALRDGHIHLHPEQPDLHLHLHSRGSPDAATGGPHEGGSGGGGGANAAAQQQQPGPTAAVTPGTRCRFIFLRGVQWAAPETNTLSLSASLAAFWPSPLLPPDTAAGAAVGDQATASAARSSSSSAAAAAVSEQLVAHSGVAAMARELMPILLPHIRDAAAAGADHVVFAGHSLGGSLAQLLWAMTILQGHRSPNATSCHTFGSPPVLAHAGGGGGGRVLRLLRAPPAAAVNWVLEHDPVPRAMLTADPYFAAARRSLPGLGALLSLRGAMLGEGAALSSGRFLYETVGELLLLRWSARGGCEAVPVLEAEAETLLQMALDEAVSAPVRSLQYWLDHHHASYHHDLETAALAACRQQARSSRQQQQRLAEAEKQAAAAQQQQLTAAEVAGGAGWVTAVAAEAEGAPSGAEESGGAGKASAAS